MSATSHNPQNPTFQFSPICNQKLIHYETSFNLYNMKCKKCAYSTPPSRRVKKKGTDIVCVTFKLHLLCSTSCIPNSNSLWGHNLGKRYNRGPTIEGETTHFISTEEIIKTVQKEYEMRYNSAIHFSRIWEGKEAPPFAKCHLWKWNLEIWLAGQIM